MVFLTSLVERIRPLLRTYPLELAFALVVAVLACAIDYSRRPNPYIVHFLLLSPYYFATIYLTNIHRLGYKLSWLYPILGTALFGYWNWVEHQPIPLVGFCLIHILLFFTKGFERDNRKFTHLTLVTVINTAFAGILSGALCLIVLGILGGVEFLFGINLLSGWVSEKIAMFIGIFFTVCFFLMLEGRSAPYEPKQEGLLYAGDILINWIFSPAVMIYTAIVYVYLVMILFQFELPAGRVSTVILPYLGLGLFCIALRQFSENPKWQWFYCHFARLSLLPLGLLWLGIYERVADYGLTEPRIYLIAIAVLVTLFMLLSLSQKTLQYRLFSGLTIVTVVVMTMLLNPTKLAEESQHREWLALLKQHNLLNEQGTIRQDVLDGKSKLTLNEKDADRLSDISYHLSDEQKEFYGRENLSRLRDFVRGEYATREEMSPVHGFYHRFDNQVIDVKQYREFYYLSYDRLMVHYLSENIDDISTISFVDDNQKTVFTVNQQAIVSVLQQNGIENGKLYRESELVPVVEKLSTLVTNDGSLLLLRGIALRYSENHKHYILNRADIVGYFKK